MFITARKDALDLEGECIDRYHLCHLLASGENVPVYLGYDMGTERKVAIKVIDSTYPDEIRSQLFNEKALLAVLGHQHIVRMLDFVECPPFALLVTEYAVCGSLRDRLNARKKLSASTRVKYIIQAASALQYIHDHGYIHRDVKPENMLLGSDDSILLCDVGIAVPIPSGKDRTNSMGTASYVAPEQIHGYPSPKSDQYSLAIVAYELLCGTPPFSGPLSHLIWKQILLDPLLPHSRSKKLSPVTERVIKKALAKDPEKRFSRIETFALELGNSLLSPSSVTDEIECVPKPQETTDCGQRYIHTTHQHLTLPNTTCLE
jgi:eukaryotic-like serine/threonine-protein kinase